MQDPRTWPALRDLKMQKPTIDVVVNGLSLSIR
jgi:hypothetical protein